MKRKSCSASTTLKLKLIPDILGVVFEYLPSCDRLGIAASLVALKHHDIYDVILGSLNRTSEYFGERKTACEHLTSVHPTLCDGGLLRTEQRVEFRGEVEKDDIDLFRRCTFLRLGKCVKPLEFKDIPPWTTRLAADVDHYCGIGYIPTSVVRLELTMNKRPLMTKDVSTNIIYFILRTNQELTPGVIHPNITHLTIITDQELVPGSVPLGVVDLTIITDQELVPGLVPLSVSNLTIVTKRAIGVGVVHSGVRKLTFGGGFNQPLEVGVIPKGVLEITFSCWFNQDLGIDMIPMGTVTVVFGAEYNRYLAPGVLPITITTLSFGAYFNQPLVGEGADDVHVRVIPANTQNVTFHSTFQDLSGHVLPKSVTDLTFQGIDRNMPFSRKLLTPFVRTLRFLYRANVSTVPDGVVDVFLGDMWNHVLTLNTFPKTTRRVTFGWGFNQPIKRGVFHSQMEHVTFGGGFDQILQPGIFHKNMKSVTFNAGYKHTLGQNIIPNGTVVYYERHAPSPTTPFYKSTLLE